MPRSAAYARLQRDLLRLVDAIPAGRVATMELLARAIDVPTRHVAYILAALDADARERHPWHRTVGRDGRWPHRHSGGVERLLAEGVTVAAGAVPDWRAIEHVPDAAALPLEAPRRPLPYTRTAGDRALAEARGLGAASVERLVRLGVRTMAELRAADPVDLYARARRIAPRTSLNFLYALIGAVEDRDWREVARDGRTGLLLELDRRGLLSPDAARRGPAEGAARARAARPAPGARRR